MTSVRGHLGHTQPASIGSARSFLTREGRHFIPHSVGRDGSFPGKVTTRTGTESPKLDRRARHIFSNRAPHSTTFL
ncbi:hypothetical protein BDFB_012133 [Asbolus verrucosus]|uniref:Uncharacterized protein n=1 Tax=Asbolus verrucosus TaxID=1661398 RepID=A0A482VS72_ASBVE|nr:hypothetical protein BDFB_012133 [Asbolus verrucosus]